MHFAIALIIGIYLGWLAHDFFTEPQLVITESKSESLLLKSTPHKSKLKFEPKKPKVAQQSQARLLIKQSEADIALGNYISALNAIEQVLAQVQDDFPNQAVEQLFIDISKLYLKELGDDNNVEKKHFLFKVLDILPDYLQFRYLLGELLISLEDYEGAAYQMHFLANNMRWKKQFNALESAINYHKIFEQGEIEIPLIKLVNAWHIEVVINGTIARFILDTGADTTVVSKHLIGYNYQHLGNIVASTANGKLNAFMAKISQFSVGSVSKNDFLMIVLPEAKLPAGIDGLLGLDWLSAFDFVIDKKHEVLRLTPVVN